jgi:hypothetical protein
MINNLMLLWGITSVYFENHAEPKWVLVNQTTPSKERRHWCAILTTNIWISIKKLLKEMNDN